MPFFGPKISVFGPRARAGLIKKNSKYLDAQRVGASWRYQNTWIFGKLSNGLWPFHCRKIMFQCSSKKSLVKALFKGPKYATWIGGLKMPPPWNFSENSSFLAASSVPESTNIFVFKSKFLNEGVAWEKSYFFLAMILFVTSKHFNLHRPPPPIALLAHISKLSNKLSDAGIFHWTFG